MNILLPMDLMDSFTVVVAPCPMASMTTTAPTPITMPNMVNPVRKRFWAMARQASAMMDVRFILFETTNEHE